LLRRYRTLLIEVAAVVYLAGLLALGAFSREEIAAAVGFVKTGVASLRWAIV